MTISDTTEVETMASAAMAYTLSVRIITASVWEKNDLQQLIHRVLF